MLDLCHIRKGQMPALYESYEVVGTLLPDTARELGLSPHCKVMAGASDNAAAAIGTGTVGDGTCNISLGTSGTIFIPSTRFHQVTGHALHSFNHADGSYHLYHRLYNHGNAMPKAVQESSFCADAVLMYSS